MELVKLTHDNIDQEHICCAISSSKDVQVLSKKNWLTERGSCVPKRQCPGEMLH